MDRISVPVGRIAGAVFFVASAALLVLSLVWWSSLNTILLCAISVYWGLALYPGKPPRREGTKLAAIGAVAGVVILALAVHNALILFPVDPLAWAVLPCVARGALHRAVNALPAGSGGSDGASVCGSDGRQ